MRYCTATKRQPLVCVAVGAHAGMLLLAGITIPVMLLQLEGETVKGALTKLLHGHI